MDLWNCKTRLPPPHGWRLQNHPVQSDWSLSLGNFVILIKKEIDVPP
jgi:hypothetical protein